MALQNFPGSRRAYIGPTRTAVELTSPASTVASVLDATNEAIILIGQIETSDGGSHTIDTSGASALLWRSGTVVFNNAGTTVKVGLAAVDTSTGPPARAVNSSDVITFDVSRTMIGGEGGITSSAAQNHVPDSGSKTIANGDLVAFAVQVTSRAGSDSIQAATSSSVTASVHRPSNTLFTSGSYTNQAAVPNCFITFSDGATGWFYGGEVLSTKETTIALGSDEERGMLFELPFPTKVFGAYGWVDPDVNFEVVLYSDPLGSTPVAEKTVSVDLNTTASSTGRLFEVLFASPYSLSAGQQIGIVFKSSSAFITVYQKVYNSDDHRISDVWGTDGLRLHRTGVSGAFSTALTSALYIGLIVGAFEDGLPPFIRPDADSSDGTWTDQVGGTSLFAAIDESVAADTDYIRSAIAPANDVCKISLSDPSETPSEPVTVVYRYRKNGTTQINLRVRLLQGVTEIASWTHNDITESFVDGEQELTGLQFAAISDFDDLFLEFTANP